MKSNLRMGIIFVIVAIILIALFQAGRKDPLDWRESYDPRKKTPFATYVLKNELQNFYEVKPKFTKIEESIYSFFSEERENAKSEAFVFVGNNPLSGNEGLNKLVSFVDQGGTAFIASNQLNFYLLDTLGVDYSYKYNFYKDSSKIQLLKYNQEAAYDKINDHIFFTKLNEDRITILGNIVLKDIDNSDTLLKAPNFIRLTHGNGVFYIHLTPQVFTNYYLLEEDTFPIALLSLKYLEGKDILWYDDFYNADISYSPMRFIWSEPGLRNAWYILLVALLLLLVFKSKREQRIIPIITPEENKTVEFAKTIGSVYFENGEPDDMVAKKIQYFLYDIRRIHKLDTNELHDKRFIHSLSQRTGIDKNEIIDLINEIERLRNKKNCTVEDLKHTYHLIEDFKQKAKMI